MQIEYKAQYRKKRENPFTPHPSPIATKTVKIDKGIPFKEVVEMAKRGAPNGYEFIRVERI